MNATARGHPATASETRQDLAGAGFLTAGATWLRDNTVGAKTASPAAAPETAPPNEAVAGDQGDDPAKIAETRPGNAGGSKLQQTAGSLRPLEQVRLALPPGAREALTTTTNEVVAKINRSAGALPSLDGLSRLQQPGDQDHYLLIATSGPGGVQYSDVNNHNRHALALIHGRLVTKIPTGTSIGAAFRKTAGPMAKKNFQVSNVADQLDDLYAISSTDLKQVPNRHGQATPDKTSTEPLGASADFGHAKLHLLYMPYQNHKDWTVASFPKTLGDLSKGAPYLEDPLRDLWYPDRGPTMPANKTGDEPETDVFAKAQKATLDAQNQLGKLLEGFHVVALPDGSTSVFHSAETFNAFMREQGKKAANDARLFRSVQEEAQRSGLKLEERTLRMMRDELDRCTATLKLRR